MPSLITPQDHCVYSVGGILALKFYTRQDVRTVPFREDEEAVVAPSHRQAAQLAGETSAVAPAGQITGPLSGVVKDIQVPFPYVCIRTCARGYYTVELTHVAIDVYSA
jgi:hypothetical protein